MNLALLSLIAALALGVLARMASGGFPLPDATRRAAGYAALAAGALCLLLRQVGLASGFLVAGAALLVQAGARPRRRRGRGGAGSTVRSAVLEMRLDHESGAMDGVVLKGGFEGRRLSEMSLEELLRLAAEIDAGDADSLNLLRAYLDRTHPGWDDEAERPPAGGGAMTRSEALALLGLDDGATREEILAAHRRLAKRLHPDAGGTAALAAQINAAKDLLLRG